MSHRRRAGGANDTQLPPNQHKPPPAPLVSYRRRWRWHGPLLPILALLTTTIATGFHRFLARFSGKCSILFVFIYFFFYGRPHWVTYLNSFANTYLHIIYIFNYFQIHTYIYIFIDNIHYFKVLQMITHMIYSHIQKALFTLLHCLHQKILNLSF